MFSIKFTTFISKRQAEMMPKTDDGIKRALISLVSPGQPEANLQPGAWTDVLRMKFHDFHWDDGVHKVITKAQAIEILQFLTKNQHDAEEVIVHCEMGVSRSAAVSMFIADIYNLAFDRTYNRHNRYVYTMLKRAYGQALDHNDAPVLEPGHLPGYHGLGDVNAQLD